MKINISGRNVNLAWLVVAALYVSCWFLPIQKGDIGFDGAEFAHKEFGRLLSGETDIDSLGRVFGAGFVLLGLFTATCYVCF